MRQTGQGAVEGVALSPKVTIDLRHFRQPECPHARLAGFIINFKLQYLETNILLFFFIKKNQHPDILFAVLNAFSVDFQNTIYLFCSWAIVV